MSSVMMRGANTRASVGGRRLNRRGCAQRVACRSVMEARSMATATVPAMKTPDGSEEALIMEVATKSGALDTPAAANHGEEEDGEMEYEDYSTTSKTYDTTRAPIGLDSLTRALEIAAGDRPAEELKLLDVGCGTGNYLDVVKHQVGSCHGLEFNEGMLAQSLAKHAGDERVSLMEGSVFDMSCFDASSFDTVIMTQVLHHLTPQTHSQALSEISRVLKPGGTFWISTQTPIQHMEGFWWAPLIPQASATVSSPISILPATPAVRAMRAPIRAPIRAPRAASLFSRRIRVLVPAGGSLPRQPEVQPAAGQRRIAAPLDRRARCTADETGGLP